MPNRPFFRGPRRPQPAGDEGAPGESAPQSGPVGEGAEGGRPGGRRRRRGRGGRGLRPGASVEGAAEVGAPGEPAATQRPYAAEEGGEGARRRRRRRGRGRRGAGLGAEAGGIPEVVAGAVPADYIPLQIERGMPVLYEPPERELLAEEAEEEPAKPQKAKRINSGKLFWYIRSKSYVPIPELRRRFEITADDMGTIQDNGQKLYIGLPQDVADVVANLRRQQKIGIECSVDFNTPVVIGVFPLYRSDR